MSHWKTPYENLPKDKRFAVVFDVHIDDHRLIKSISCTHGTISKFLQTLYHDVASYARANNLSVVDSDAFIHYLRQRADSRFAAETGARDVGAGTAGLRQDPPHGSDESPSISEATQGGRGGKGTKARKGGRGV